MGRIANLFSIVAVSTVLAASGVGTYLWASGQWKGGDTLASDAHADALEGHSPTSAPATAVPGATVAVGDHGIQALMRIESRHRERDLAVQQELLDQTLHQLVLQQEKIDQDKKQLAQQRDKAQSAGKDSGFERELEYFKKLPAKQAKQHLLKVWAKHPADAVRLITALKTAEGTRVLEQLKSPEELQILHELLEQLRQQNPAAPGQGSASRPSTS